MAEHPKAGNDMTPDPMDTFPAFMEQVRARMEKGAAAYGDASFSRPPEELSREIAEELLDVCGWSFILWTRIETLRHRTAAIEADADH